MTATLCPWHHQQRGVCCPASAGVIVTVDLLERVQSALSVADLPGLADEVQLVLTEAGT